MTLKRGVIVPYKHENLSKLTIWTFMIHIRKVRDKRGNFKGKKAKLMLQYCYSSLWEFLIPVGLPRTLHNISSATDGHWSRITSQTSTSLHSGMHQQVQGIVSLHLKVTGGSLCILSSKSRDGVREGWGYFKCHKSNIYCIYLMFMYLAIQRISSL